MSTTPSTLDRREFVMTGLTVSALGSALALAGSRAMAQAGQQAAPAADVKKPESASQEIDASKLIPDSNPLVVALKYTPDATKAQLRNTVRQGVSAKDQFCNGCQLYKAAGTLKGTKDEVGVCQMIPGGNVMGRGWCNSWVKKA
jgi:hypothetical protein